MCDLLPSCRLLFLGAALAAAGFSAAPVPTMTLAEIERALADHPARWGDGDARAAILAALDQQVSIQIRKGWTDDERARLKPLHEFYLHRIDAGLAKLEATPVTQGVHVFKCYSSSYVFRTAAGTVAVDFCQGPINNGGEPEQRDEYRSGFFHIRPAGDPAVDSADLQRAINDLLKTGGRLVLQPGVFRLRRGLAINNSKQPLELTAEPGAVLRLEPARVARLAAAAAADAREVQIDNGGGFSAGDRVELWLTDEGKFVDRRIRAVSGKTLQLDGLLGAALAAGATVVSTDNAVLVWDSENVTLSGLEIDLQRERQPVVPRNHTVQCGILVNAVKHAVWFGRGTRDNVIAGNRYSPGLQQAAIVALGRNNRLEGNDETAVPPPALLLASPTNPLP